MSTSSARARLPSPGLWLGRERRRIEVLGVSYHRFRPIASVARSPAFSGIASLDWDSLHI